MPLTRPPSNPSDDLMQRLAVTDVGTDPTAIHTGWDIWSMGIVALTMLVGNHNMPYKAHVQARDAARTAVFDRAKDQTQGDLTQDVVLEMYTSVFMRVFVGALREVMEHHLSAEGMEPVKQAILGALHPDPDQRTMPSVLENVTERDSLSDDESDDDDGDQQEELEEELEENMQNVGGSIGDDQR
jgi:hypothetical protein